MDTLDLQELAASYERTGAPVLWLSCDGQTDVWELFTDNFAAPVDLRAKEADSFSPQTLQGSWSKMKIKNSKVVVMSLTVFTKYTKKKEVIWQQYRLCFGHSRISNSRWYTFPYSKTTIKKVWVVEECTILSEEVPLQMDPFARHATQVSGFFTILVINMPMRHHL